MKCIFLSLVMLVSLPAVSIADDHGWHVLCVTQGGMVSVIHGLTHEQAQFVHDRLLGLPATAEEKANDAAARRRQLAEQAKREADIQAHPAEYFPPCGDKKPHPKAIGCTDNQGGEIMWASMGDMRVIQPSDMKTVEMFR